MNNSRDKILEVIELMENGMSENKACQTVEINRATFRSAVLKEKVADEYARALVALASDQIEKTELAIEDMRSGTIDAQMARVEIDTRKWFASKLLPRKYGDKLDVTSDGKSISQVESLTDEQINERIQDYLNRNKA